ncbi:MAG: helix-turn-helix domain-containing protein, partial [Sneathiella sp.]|nr:helix-turn-helix domain-containing protein [Sneathiella sp.]
MVEKKIGSVERALTVLNCFDRQQTSLTLTHISNETGYYKSTVLRLTEQLIAYGYLMRDTDKTYKLGSSIGRLGAVYQSTHSVENDILPYLQELSDKTEESSSYIILRGDMRVCQLQVNSKHRIRLHLEQGEELALNRGASARLLRAFRGDIWDGCEEIKACGWAISVGERDPDVASVANVLIGSSGK